MSKTQTFEFLIQLAVEKRDLAARALAGSRRQAEDAHRKLDMLSRYHRDYLARVHNADAGGGTDPVRIANYRAFIDKLELALHQQQRDTEACESYSNACFHRLQGEEKKLRSLQTAHGRRADEAKRSAGRFEQKRMDEFAARAASSGASRFNLKSA
jgi:flagellar FliJ protein